MSCLSTYKLAMINRLVAQAVDKLYVSRDEPLSTGYKCFCLFSPCHVPLTMRPNGSQS